jgi:hypothetical protein
VSHLAGGQRSAPAVLLAIALLCAGRADAATVILVPPVAPSAAMSEALVRVRGELVSEGFAVEVVDAPVEGSARGFIDQLGDHGRADAVVAMIGDRMPDAVEIGIVDPLTNKLVVRRMSFQPASEVTAKTLAIHTLELIRATFLEVDLMPAPGRPAPGPQPHPPPAASAEAAPRPPERVSVDVGATAIFDFEAGAPVLLPLVRVSWALRPWLLPQLEAAGLGTRRTVSSNGATAQIAQQFAVVGASCRFRAGMRLRPFLSLSAGVLRTSAQGQALPPDWGRQAEQWSLLLDGGAGTWLALGDRFQLALALQAQLAEPYPAVRFSDSVVKPSTHPSLLLTLTLGSWL